MSLRALRHCAFLCVFTLAGAVAMRAQSAVEYGILTGNSAAAATAAARPAIPIPNFPMPSGPASPGPSAISSAVPAGTAEEAAKTNRQFLQSHSGPNAAQLAVHTVPDHAEAWIDGKFVGPAPLDMKLAPGHHQLLVRAINMQETTREFDLAAKQTQAIDLALKSSYQNQVVIHWPSQQK
jgi:PEGA domain-containing protein